jgi:hypothetical protein
LSRANRRANRNHAYWRTRVRLGFVIGHCSASRGWNSTWGPLIKKFDSRPYQHTSATKIPPKSGTSR